MPSSSGDAPPGPEVPGPVGGYRNAPVTAPGSTSTVPDVAGGPPGLSGVVFVDPDALNRAAAVAADAASEAASDAQRLDSAVNRSGAAPWGDDPGLGQSFGSVFADPRHALLQAMDTLPEVLGELADTLRQTSRTFSAADAEPL